MNFFSVDFSNALVVGLFIGCVLTALILVGIAIVYSPRGHDRARMRRTHWSPGNTPIPQPPTPEGMRQRAQTAQLRRKQKKNER